MRKLIVIAWLFVAIAAAGAVRFTTTVERASRAFDNREWANAAALYELLLAERADSAALYARAIVANSMIADTAASMELMERAMAHGLPFDSVLADVRESSFAIGHGNRYADYLLAMRGHFPWMRRAVDKALLEYYSFRNDGPQIVAYSQLMLAGLPDSPEYRLALAKGYLLTGSNDLAVETLKKILADNPANIEALLWLGSYYQRSHRPDEALPYLAEAYRLRPTPYLARLLRIDSEKPRR